MKIKDRVQVNVDYTTGNTIDDLLNSIKKTYEAYTEDLDVDSVSLESEYQEYSDEKSTMLIIYYTREETPREIQRREQQEEALLNLEKLQYERLKRKFG